MDPNFNIYEAEEVPEEDKARLDGYLHARAEEGERRRMKEKLAELEDLREKLKPNVE